jgi:hypothetical protein
VSVRHLHAYQAREALAALAFLGAPDAEDRSVEGDNRRLELLARLQAAILGRPVPVLVMPKAADVDASEVVDAVLPASPFRTVEGVDLAEIEVPVMGLFHAPDENPGGAL